jgi:hypothetical protein
LDSFRADTEELIPMPKHDNIRGADYYQ